MHDEIRIINYKMNSVENCTVEARIFSTSLPDDGESEQTVAKMLADVLGNRKCRIDFHITVAFMRFWVKFDPERGFFYQIGRNGYRIDFAFQNVFDKLKGGD
jgi:hypothetical protein